MLKKVKMSHVMCNDFVVGVSDLKMPIKSACLYIDLPWGGK
jgi:hypothetical protein